MHELGVTFSIMDTLEDVAKKNDVKNISEVILELGQVSTVIPSYLQDCWQWACKKRDLFNDCKLNIETIEAISLCNSCNEKYSTVTFKKICPKCGSEDTVLYRGNEFNIKEIKVVCDSEPGSLSQNKK